MDGPDELPVARRRRMPRYTRVLLVLMAFGFTAVLGTAAWLNPYQGDGTAMTMRAHTQLGLPPCSMESLMGKPCPACGMTTSFALLAHGDVPNSLRANWVGTLLAVFWFALIPWSLFSAARARLVGIRNGEVATTIAVGAFITLMLARWAVVLLT
jgi:hypothetical protein